MMIQMPLGDHERRIILEALRAYVATPADQLLVTGLVESFESEERRRSVHPLAS
jgi:hypothetical protein